MHARNSAFFRVPHQLASKFPIIPTTYRDRPKNPGHPPPILKSRITRPASRLLHLVSAKVASRTETRISQ